MTTDGGNAMTTNTIAQPTCPSCGRDDAIDLDSGDKLCLNCRNEWDPRVVAPSTPVAASPPVLDADDRIDVADILAATSIEDVLAPALTGAELMREHGIAVVDDVPPDDLAGHFIRNEATGDTWLVTEDMGDAWLVAENAEGHSVRLLRSEATDLGTDTEEGVAPTVAGVVDDNAPHVPTIATVASLVLVVGCEAVANDEDRTLLNPRIGWLPPPASDIPEVEQGAAYAVATLIRFYGLPKDEIETIAASLLAGATEQVEEGESE